MTATTSTPTGGRTERRLVRRRAGRASILLGLTVLFASGMTGQAFSDPGHGSGQGPGDPPAKITICHATGSEANPYDETTISVNGLHGHEGHEGDIIPAPEGGCPVPDVEPKRITICHATASETNPYEEITISVNGLHGHEGHEGDIIPAPEGGCPVPDVEPKRITICHATGSETNPYEVLTLPESALNGHDGHEGDIIPAPEGGCPVPTTTTTTVPVTTTTVPETTTTTVPETTTTTVPETTTTTVPETTTTVPETTTTTVPETTTTTVAETTTTTVAETTITTVAGATVTTGETTRPTVLGLTLEAGNGNGNAGGGAPSPTSTVLGAHFERSGGTLARTGSELTGLATFGLALLALGALLKLSARPAPATVRVPAERN